MLKPVQHEHTVEVKIPGVLAENADKIKQHMEENKKSYLFGVGGLALGIAVARIFSRPTINIEVLVGKDMA